MRKKVIFGTVAALFLGAGIFTSVNLTQKPKMSNLTLANIEAMTQYKLDHDDENTLDIHSTEGVCLVYNPRTNKYEEGGAKVQCQSGHAFPKCPDCYL